MGNPYPIFINSWHEHVYTDEQLVSYGARYLIPYSIALAIYLYILFLFPGNKGLLASLKHTLEKHD